MIKLFPSLLLTCTPLEAAEYLPLVLPPKKVHTIGVPLSRDVPEILDVLKLYITKLKVPGVNLQQTVRDRNEKHVETNRLVACTRWAMRFARCGV